MGSDGRSQANNALDSSNRVVPVQKACLPGFLDEHSGSPADFKADPPLCLPVRIIIILVIFQAG